MCVSHLWQPDPDLENNKFWLPVLSKGEPHGQVLLSIQLIPSEHVERLPAGDGRKVSVCFGPTRTASSPRFGVSIGQPSTCE